MQEAVRASRAASKSTAASPAASDKKTKKAASTVHSSPALPTPNGAAQSGGMKSDSSSFATTSAVKSNNNGSKNTLTFSERKEMNKLEKEVEKLTTQVAQWEEKITTGGAKGEGYSVLADWTKQMQVLQLKLVEKESAWMELASKDV